MEKTIQIAVPGTRQLKLKKSLKMGIRSLLTTYSKEKFLKEFPRFTNAEQDHLHQIFVQVITTLHEIIEDEFESLCREMQVGTTLDTVEQLVEDQSLDPLFSDKSVIGDIALHLCTSKKNEIQYLMGMLEKAEEQKWVISSRVELLKKQNQDLSGAAEAVEKLGTGIMNHEMGNSTGPHDS